MQNLFRLAADRPVGLLPVAVMLGLLCFVPAAAQDAATTISGERMSIVRDREDVVVRQRDQLLLRYRYRGVPKKPYVAEMTCPGGTNILLDAPADHLHHHGLMFAWGVDGLTFWAETKDSGLQIHKEWKGLRIEPHGAAERAVLHEHLLWQTPGGKVLLEEQRKLTIPAAAKQQPRMLTWQADFTSGKEATAARTIAGSKYYGLGIRFIRPMDKGGRHFNAEGGAGVAGTNGQRAAWSAYTAEVSPGKKVTVAMFSHPANPRHPCEWFTMGRQQAFAYLSGTLGVGIKPLKLEPGTTLTVRYAVAIFQGEADAKHVESFYRTLPWAAKQVHAETGQPSPSATRNTP
jgi:hypothetical protein